MDDENARPSVVSNDVDDHERDDLLRDLEFFRSKPCINRAQAVNETQAAFRSTLYTHLITWVTSLTRPLQDDELGRIRAVCEDFEVTINEWNNDIYDADDEDDLLFFRSMCRQSVMTCQDQFPLEE